jgi:hypothetical protein
MLGNRSPKEEVSMAKHWVRSQPDLFEKKPRPAMALAPVERAKALQQLQALLMEATTILENRSEASDDQDHA